MPRLVDSRTGEEHLLAKDSVVIGRHRSCDIIIPVVEVSRRHCRIFIDDGVYYVEDQGTVNGTFVNDKMIRSAHLLQEGFHLKIGKCTKFPAGVKTFIFRMPRIKLDKETRSLRRELLEEIIDDSKPAVSAPVTDAAPSTHVELRHCALSIGRRKEPLVRAPLVRFESGELGFYALLELPVGEVLQLEFAHPSWPLPLQFMGTVVRVGRVKDRDVYQVDAQINEAQNTLASMAKRITMGPLIKYFA
jgi:hypothetical protein